KNGTARQKAQMHTLTELTRRHPQSQRLAMELAHDVTQGMFESVGEMLATTGSMAADLLGLLMAPVEGAGEQQSPIEEEEKRHKRKKKAQSRGIRRRILRVVQGIRPLHRPAKITLGVGKVKCI